MTEVANTRPPAIARWRRRQARASVRPTSPSGGAAAVSREQMMRNRRVAVALSGAAAGVLVGAAAGHVIQHPFTLRAALAVCGLTVYELLAGRRQGAATSYEGNPATATVCTAIVGIVGGWAAGALAGSCWTLLYDARRRNWQALPLNSCMFACAGASAGLVAAAAAPLGWLPAALLATGAFELCNVVVFALVLSLSVRRRLDLTFVQVGRDCAHELAPMSGTLIGVALWRYDPLAVLLLGSLVVTTLSWARADDQARVQAEVAATDELTGLWNSRRFRARIDEELDRHERDGGTLSLLLIDLDDFKQVNDTFGHAVGDELLRSVAAVLADGGEAFRIGGDEFALLCPKTAPAVALTFGEMLIARGAQIEYSPGLRPGLSVGVAAYPDDAGRDEFIRAADKALYRAKASGKGNACAVPAGA